jgi:hypothetical protein
VSLGARSHKRSRFRVVDGRAQRRNRWLETPNYYNTPQPSPVVDRLKPGPGYVHLLRKKDVREFLRILPEWPELAAGLDAIVLSTGSEEYYGWHVPGVVHVCAWQRHLWDIVDHRGLAEMESILARLEVPVDKRGSLYRLMWTRGKARAFQLVEVLLHELGHHHDRMTTRRQGDPARGEQYADEFAAGRREAIWERFVAHFGID